MTRRESVLEFIEKMKETTENDTTPEGNEELREDQTMMPLYFVVMLACMTVGNELLEKGAPEQGATMRILNCLNDVAENFLQ